MDQFEEELVAGNVSSIYNETSYDYELPVFYRVWHALSIVSYLVGGAANVFIIHAILTNKQMRSRTNKLILNWSICDVSYVVLTILIEVYYYYGDFMETSYLSECVLWHSDVIFRFLGFMFIGVLMSNQLIRTKFVTDRGLLWILWGVAMTLIFINTNLCIIHQVYATIYMCSFALCTSMLITLIWKEVNSCCKQHRDAPVSDRTKYRLNIAAIYVYNWFMSWCFGIMSEVFYRYTPAAQYLKIFYLSGSLSSVYVLFYITYADSQFKVYMYKILGRSFDVDATVNFSEYSGDEEVAEEGEVNIVIGEDGKVIKRQRE